MDTTVYTRPFLAIYASGLCNITPIEKRWVKPTEAKGRYIELGWDDLTPPAESDKSGIFKLPELKFKLKRKAFMGNSFLVVIHPRLTNNGVFVIEAIDGTNVFADLPAGFRQPKELVSYVARIYEFNNGGIC